jgi:hypothetical protein
MTAWRKSSFSDGGGSDCVEVALTPARVAVRDSKNQVGPTLRLPIAAWRQLIAECAQ